MPILRPFPRLQGICSMPNESRYHPDDNDRAVTTARRYGVRRARKFRRPCRLYRARYGQSTVGSGRPQSPPEEIPMTQSQIHEYISDVLAHCVWWFAHLLVFAGLGLIVHEVLVSFGMPTIISSWFLEKISTPIE